MRIALLCPVAPWSHPFIAIRQTLLAMAMMARVLEGREADIDRWCPKSESRRSGCMWQSKGFFADIRVVILSLHCKKGKARRVEVVRSFGRCVEKAMRSLRVARE
jgi:hypothetical protein